MNRFAWRFFLIGLIVFVLGLNAPARAAGTASIVGTVEASPTEVISAAKVELLGATPTMTTTSGKNGRFQFLSLTPGTYVLRVSAQSYETTESNPLALSAGQDLALTVVLQPVTTTNISSLGRVSVLGHPTLNTSSAASTTITSTQFLNQGATQVQNALEQLNGITVDRPNGVTSAPGAVTTFTIRGAGAFGGGTDGTANTGYEILVLQDGEPVRNGQFGDFDASALTPAIYSRVEVIKGVGGTSLFGANTIGGTVNLVTRDPTRTEGGEFIQTLGGYGTTDYNLSESNTIGRLGYLINLHRLGTDGYVDANFLASFNGVIDHPTQMLNLKSGLGKLRYDFSKATYAVLGTSLESDWRDQVGLISNPNLNSDGSVQIDPSNGLQSFFGFPANFVYNIQPKYWVDFHTTLGGGDLILRSYSQTLERTVDGTAPAVCCFLSFSRDRLTGDLISWSKELGNNTLTLAAGANGDNFFFGESFAGAVPFSSLKPSATGIQIERTYLVRDDLRASPRLDLTFAGYYSDYDTLRVKRFDPRLGVVYKPDANSVLHGSIGTGFAPPRLSDIFTALDLAKRDAGFGPGCSACVAFSGNPDLNAETATGYDIGYQRLFANNGELNVDLYRTDLKNHIFDGIFPSTGLKFDDGSPVSFVQQAINLAGSVYQGIEFNGTVPVSPNFSGTLNYNVQSAYPTGVDLFTQQQLGNVINNQQYLGVPLQKWGWNANYRNRAKASAFFGGNYFGKNNSYNRMPFWIYNAGADIAANDNDRLHIAWTNIFNKNAGIWEDFGFGIPYPSVSGCVPCFSSPLPNTYPTNGYNSPPHMLTVSFDHRWGSLRQF